MCTSCSVTLSVFVIVHNLCKSERRKRGDWEEERRLYFTPPPSLRLCCLLSARSNTRIVHPVGDRDFTQSTSCRPVLNVLSQITWTIKATAAKEIISRDNCYAEELPGRSGMACYLQAISNFKFLLDKRTVINNHHHGS